MASAVWLSLAAGAPAFGAAPFILEQTAPAHGGVAVSPSQPIVLTFSQPVDPASVQVDGFSPAVSLTPAWGPGGVPIDLSPTLDSTGTVLTLSHAVPFAEGSTVVVRVAGGSDPHPLLSLAAKPKPLSGSAVPNPFLFSVGSAAGPSIVWHSPASGATDVDPSLPVQVAFSRPMAPSSLVLEPPTPPMAAAWDASDEVLTLQAPAPGLPAGVTVSVSLSITDAAGNPLQLPALPTAANENDWTFTTTAAPPAGPPPAVIGSSPAPGALGVSPSDPIDLRFSSALDENSLAVRLQEAITGTSVATSLSWLSATEVHVVHPLLATGPTGYTLQVVSGRDAAGRPLVPGILPDGALRFTTQDRTPPTLLATDPSNGATVDPTVPGSAIQALFSEPLSTSGATDAVLSFTNLTGTALPLPAAGFADLLPGVAGRWRLLPSAFDASATHLRLPLQPDAAGFFFPPGDTLEIQINGFDLAGNGLALNGPIPDPWSFSASDPRPPTVLSIVPPDGSAVSLAAPVILRFNKMPESDRMGFEADGDWSGSATISDALPMLWLPNSGAWSSAGPPFTLTLAHAPFPESSPGATNTHTFRCVSLNVVFNGSIPHVVETGTLAQTTFTTGRRPRVASVQFQAPVTSADLVGSALADPSDPTRWAWKELDGPTLGTVPINSALRFSFTDAMQPSTVPRPVLNPDIADWSLAWESDNRAVVCTPAVPLISRPIQWARDAGGDLAAVAPVYSGLTFVNGQDVVGDALAGDPFAFSTIDAVPPAFTVEYLSNPLPDGSAPLPPSAVWLPLDGATALPPRTRLRVRADKTLGSPPVTLDSLPGGLDLAALLPQPGHREDAGGVGNAVEVTFGAPLQASALIGSPKVEATAYLVRVTAHDAAAVPAGGNTATAMISLPVPDTLPPQLAAAAAEGPDRQPRPLAAARPGDVVRLTFTEPVDLLSVAIHELSTGGQPDAPYLIAADPDPRSVRAIPQQDASGAYPAPPFTLQVQAGVRDLAGNTQTSLPLLNDPAGFLDRLVVGRPYGDLNGDGQVTWADAVLALHLAFHPPATLDPAVLFAGDVLPVPGLDGRPRGDGAIGVEDVVWILRRSLGLPVP